MLPIGWVRRHWLLTILATLLVLVLAGWQATLNFLGRYLALSQAPQPADLILVLAGDFWGSRVVKGADLAVQGYAPLALMSGIPYQNSQHGALAIEFLSKQGYPTRLFQSYSHDANSTIEEAIALRPELERRGAKRVLLVTSAHHSRRAAIVFRLFCPSIQFIAVAASDPHYNPDGWWRDPSSRTLFFSEWAKIIGTVLWVYPKQRIGRMVGN